MRLFVSLCLLLAVGAAAAISPEEIAAARQACTQQCQDNDKVVMAKCMRACWKNFFDGHHTTTTTTHQKKHVVETHAPKKLKVAHPQQEHHPQEQEHKIVKPKMTGAIKTHAAPAHAPLKKKNNPKKNKVVRSAFAERKTQSLGHSLGRMGPKSMEALLRAGASSLGVNAGLLLCLLTVGAFLMA